MIVCRARRCLGAFAILVCGWSCGIQPVELRPGESETGTDKLVVGKNVPVGAIAQLQAQRNQQGEEALQLIYPAPSPDALVVPADLAPITFEWRAGKKANGMPMAPGIPMPDDMMMPMGMAAMAMEPPPPTAAKPGNAAGQAAPAPPPPPPDMKADKGKKAEKDRVVAYELNLHDASTGMRVYVADVQVALPRKTWSELLRRFSGSTLTVELRGVREDGAIVHAAPLSISVRGEMPAGLFYNFSTSSPGLTRARLADAHETRVQVPLSSENGSGCVGCHVISSDGKRMLAATAAPSQLFRWPVLSDAAQVLNWPSPVSSGAGRNYIRGTFDPAAARIAAAQFGTLLLFDADTGELLQRSAAPLSAAVSAPDWSPDGRTIVLEVGNVDQNTDDMPASSSLATVQVALDGRLSELKALIDSADDQNLRSPRYSPDGEWIVYEKRMGPMRDARESKLFIVRAAGGEPIELRKLASGVKPMDDARAPAFAPSDQPGHVYLLFSSRRPVGSFVPEEGQRQLFASELDLSLAAAGNDPSHPAFWLPFQQRTNSYLQGQWGPALSYCTPAAKDLCDAPGDRVDDDCDGAFDEDCCTPASESCGNNNDDDCDGAIDEGCACAFQEICANQKDDDCDLRVDEKPCMPAPPMKEP